jgi:hypothetical protein
MKNVERKKKKEEKGTRKRIKLQHIKELIDHKKT